MKITDALSVKTEQPSLNLQDQPGEPKLLN